MTMATVEHTSKLSKRLTENEAEVLSLVVGGANAEDLAARLQLSADALRATIQNIVRKLQLGSRWEANFLMRHGGTSGRR
jgi:DNA-binding NarL/FixJ family response regulator